MMFISSDLKISSGSLTVLPFLSMKVGLNVSFLVSADMSPPIYFCALAATVAINKAKKVDINFITFVVN